MTPQKTGKSLIVRNSIRIEAPPSRVWNVLTKPEYIREWDRLPEDFGDYEVHPATVINYPGYSELRVTAFERDKLIRYSMYVPAWKNLKTDHVGYAYSISTDDNGYTWLGIEIGDFAIVTEGDRYYRESVAFGETASQKIKELAERKGAVL